jgi:hypothetical protein
MLKRYSFRVEGTFECNSAEDGKDQIENAIAAHLNDSKIARINIVEE